MFPLLSSQLLAIHQCSKCFLLRKSIVTRAIVATIITKRCIKTIKQKEYIEKTSKKPTILSSVTPCFPLRKLLQQQQITHAYPLLTTIYNIRTAATTTSSLTTTTTAIEMSNKSADILRNYYDVALELVMKCGPIIRAGYSNVDAVYKQKAAFFDLVTKYDKEIEDILVEGLQRVFPESKFIGEETVAAAGGKMPELTDAPTWIIDPIDGTTNFIHRIPHWCISVGLAINKELVVGIVYNPIANEMYSAWKGHGAYLNGQRIHVRKCTEMNDAVLAYEISVIHAAAVRDKNVKRISKLAANSTGTRCMGSGALTLCYIARGSFDCYHVEDLQAWDIAGGAVILREAGGVLYHTTGGEFHIMKPNLIAAATPELAKAMVGLIQEADAMTDFTFK